jgi:hypothetical protein
MYIVNGLPYGLPLMNSQSFTAVPVVQRESAGKHMDDIWKRMGVPWKVSMVVRLSFGRLSISISQPL